MTPVERLQNIVNIIHSTGDLAVMAICGVLEDVIKTLWQNGYSKDSFEIRAINAVGAMLYNFPIYQYNHIFPEPIRCGATLLLTRVIDNLTDKE
jgi:hypothetical protein